MSLTSLITALNTVEACYHLLVKIFMDIQVPGRKTVAALSYKKEVRKRQRRSEKKKWEKEVKRRSEENWEEQFIFKSSIFICAFGGPLNILHCFYYYMLYMMMYIIQCSVYYYNNIIYLSTLFICRNYYYLFIYFLTLNISCYYLIIYNIKY